MRTTLLALAVSLMASAAAAQTADLDRLRLQDLQQRNMREQEQSLIQRRNEADLRGALADEHRRQTQDNLRALELRAAPPAFSLPAPLSPTPYDAPSQRRLPAPAAETGDARLRPAPASP